MFRRFVLAATFVVCAVSFAFSDTFVASITSVEGNKVSYKKFGGKKGGGAKGGEEGSAEAIKDVAVTKGAGFKADPDKKGEKLEGGLKNEVFAKDKIGEKGVFARITIADDGADKGKITAIETLTFGGGAGKKGKAKDDPKKDGK